MTAVSAIIPFYKVRPTLLRLLSALAPQFDGDDELILVDDGSPPHDPVVVPGGIRYRFITHSTNLGVSAARNTGARAAKNEILAFFDDDVIPSPDYLRTVRQSFDDPAVQVLQGAEDETPADDQPTLFQSYLANHWHYGETKELVADGRCECVFTSATCFRRDFLLGIGGFAEHLRTGGEEFEIGQRVLERTAIHHSPRLTYRHHHERMLPRLRTVFRRSQNFWRLFRRGRRQSKKLFSLQRQIATGAVLLSHLLFLPAAVSGHLLPYAVFLAGTMLAELPWLVYIAGRAPSRHVAPFLWFRWCETSVLGWGVIYSRFRAIWSSSSNS